MRNIACIVKKLIITTFLLTNNSCSGFKLFQPSPYENQLWSKPNFGQDEIKKTMLECGYVTPFLLSDHRIDDKPVSLDEASLIHLCMKNNGFIYNNGREDMCKGYQYLSGCKPGAKGYVRDPQRRLNSKFCKKYPAADVCR